MGEQVTFQEGFNQKFYLNTSFLIRGVLCGEAREGGNNVSAACSKRSAPCSVTAAWKAGQCSQSPRAEGSCPAWWACIQ